MQTYKTSFLAIALLSMSALVQAEVQPINSNDAKQIVNSFARVYKSGAAAHEAEIFFDASYEYHKNYITSVLQTINLEKKHLEQINYALTLLDHAASCAPRAYQEGMILSKKFNQLTQDFSKNNRSQEEIAYASQQLIEDPQFDTLKDFQAVVQELASFVDPLIQEVQEFIAQFNAQELSEEQQEQMVQATENLVKMIKPSMTLLQSIVDEMVQTH